MRPVNALCLLACSALLMMGVAFATPRPTTPAPADAAMMASGRALSLVGDCAVCHTPDGSPPYAGGRPIKTPFGVIYSTNITPDPETGIGRWTVADFRKAMREGTAPGGRQLYPAFPYDHFTKLTDGDIRALYTYLMSRTAVRAQPPQNRLIFPLGFRPLLIVWKYLFLHHDPVENDARRPPDWNRGRFLTEALAHCSACHSPRNLFGAEESAKPFAGGWADGWYAPPLNRRSPASAPWPADALYTYLRTGLSPSHAAAAGPMGPVTDELSKAPKEDVRAISIYIASLTGERARMPVAGTEDTAGPSEGATVFAGACDVCHGAGAPMMSEGRPDLALGTPLHEDTPRDVAEIIVQGLKPPVGRAGPFMPAFGSSLTDRQIAALIAYLRARYTHDPPWREDLTKAVARARAEGAV